MYGIGWGDHRAQGNRGGPRHGRNQGTRHHRDRESGETHGEHHESEDRQPVIAQVAQRRIVRRVEQHRRNEERQREFRRHRECRRSGDKREQRTTNCEEYGIRRPDTTR